MNNKGLKNLFNNIVLFLAIFLIVNYGYNYFFGKPAVPKTGIQYNIDKTSFALNDIVTAHLENYTTDDITLKSTCPKPPAVISKMENGQWKNLPAETKINCTEFPDVVIKPNEKHLITFKSWNHSLFENLGQYKSQINVVLKDNQTQSLESAQFEIVPQSFLGVIWNTIIYQPIYNALIFFASILPGNDLGLAIILLTILIRTILLFPNQKALKSQKKLQMIQPKLNELKEKHGTNQQKIAEETISIYKEHKVNPFGSCLPLIIQIPILIGLFSVVQSGLDPNNTFLLYGNLKEFNLSLINTHFLGLLELTKVNIIVLPIIVGLLQFFQMKLAMSKQKKANVNKEKKAMSEMDVANKTMTYMMPVMIAFFTASVPSGVGLYWAFSTIYGIAQQVIINRQFTEKETKIQEIKPMDKKSRKEEYKQKNLERKAQKEQTQQDLPTTKPESHHKNPEDNGKPPITIIKA